jgi:ABC-2 type transport system ATP-binding protein
MSTSPDTLAIDANGLVRKFGATVALASLDLRVRRGEMYGLVGPDGAGKSTAIRLLCGIHHPSGGQGRVLGFDLASDPASIKARIGYLSQNFTLYGDLTIDENIEFFADLHGVAGFKKRRDELLDFTRLTPFRARLAQALSGGMKKKLALACTLIHTPDMIFLDEPSTGVDPVSRGEFWSILSGILEQGVTIFMTTPYLDEAERCHRISLIHRGRTFMDGTPEEVKSRMPGKVHAIVCASPQAASKALRHQWPSKQLQVYGDHLNFWSANPAADLPRLLEAIEKLGFGPAQATVIEPSLEDAFIALLEGKN